MQCNDIHVAGSDHDLSVEADVYHDIMYCITDDMFGSKRKILIMLDTLIRELRAKIVNDPECMHDAHNSRLKVANKWWEAIEKLEVGYA